MGDSVERPSLAGGIEQAPSADSRGQPRFGTEESPVGGGSTPVVIEGLTKRLPGGVMAVEDLNLVVPQGQVVGLAGPNGAGKSVTLKILLGLVRPTAGRVELFGERVHPGARALGRVGALVDGPGFVPHLSGRENLRLASRMTTARERSGGLSGERSGGPPSEPIERSTAPSAAPSAAPPAAREAELDRAIELAALGSAIDRPYKTYSHGMRYRLGLAQALLGEPELLLLDEPTTGLDPAHISEIRQAIATAAANGATVIFSTHLLSEVERVCTHAAVMRAGRLVAYGPVSQLMAGSVSLEQAYLELVAPQEAGAGSPNGGGVER